MPNETSDLIKRLKTKTSRDDFIDTFIQQLNRLPNKQQFLNELKPVLYGIEVSEMNTHLKTLLQVVDSLSSLRPKEDEVVGYAEIWLKILSARSQRELIDVVKSEITPDNLYQQLSIILNVIQQLPSYYPLAKEASTIELVIHEANDALKQNPREQQDETEYFKQFLDLAAKRDSFRDEFKQSRNLADMQAAAQDLIAGLTSEQASWALNTVLKDIKQKLPRVKGQDQQVFKDAVQNTLDDYDTFIREGIEIDMSQFIDMHIEIEQCIYKIDDASKFSDIHKAILILLQHESDVNQVALHFLNKRIHPEGDDDPLKQDIVLMKSCIDEVLKQYHYTSDKENFDFARQLNNKITLAKRTVDVDSEKINSHDLNSLLQDAENLGAGLSKPQQYNVLSKLQQILLEQQSSPQALKMAEFLGQAINAYVEDNTEDMLSQLHELVENEANLVRSQQLEAIKEKVDNFSFRDLLDPGGIEKNAKSVRKDLDRSLKEIRQVPPELSDRVNKLSQVLEKLEVVAKRGKNMTFLANKLKSTMKNAANTDAVQDMNDHLKENRTLYKVSKLKMNGIDNKYMKQHRALAERNEPNAAAESRPRFNK